jgi:hypothetical protein
MAHLPVVAERAGHLEDPAAALAVLAVAAGEEVARAGLLEVPAKEIVAVLLCISTLLCSAND